MKSKQLNALGANIFAGGFSAGVAQHFKIVGHLEHDNYGAKIVELNRHVLGNFPLVQSPHAWADLDPPGKVHFVYANPPCAIWSVAGVKKGQAQDAWTKDPRLQRIRDIFGLVRHHQPLVWSWESVCLAFTRGTPFVNSLAAEAIKMGYAATALLVDAKFLNTPQSRKRFFLVLHRVAIDWKCDFEKTITVSEALRGVRVTKEERPLPKNIKDLYPKSRPGEDFAKVYARVVPEKKRRYNAEGQTIGRPSFLVKRMHADRPAYTVIGDGHLLHPTQPRSLTTVELGRLCGFPKEWNWGPGQQGSLVARGVCPTVGEWLARHVAAGIRKDQRVKPGRRIVDLRAAPGSFIELGPKETF